MPVRMEGKTAPLRRKNSTNPRRENPFQPPLLPAAVLLLGMVLLLAACQTPVEAQRMAAKGRQLWEGGRYEDAARNFVTLSELYPDTPLAQESLFWAANLYHHYLKNRKLAARYYQHLIVTYPHERYFYKAKENLAALYEESYSSLHRALQIYQQLLLTDHYAGKRDFLRFKIGTLNLQLGKLDQARLSFRDLLSKHPKSSYRGKAYYLVGYSYYLEKRYDLGMAVFRQTAEGFPGTPIANRARFFIADTLEERGDLRKALKAYKALKDQDYNPEILKKRIQSLQARIRRGVR